MIFPFNDFQHLVDLEQEFGLLMAIVTDDRFGERHIISRSLVSGDVANLVDNDLAHDRCGEGEELLSICRLYVAAGQELDEGFVDQRGGAAAGAALGPTPRHGLEFRIEERGELIEGRVVTVPMRFEKDRYRRGHSERSMVKTLLDKNVAQLQDSRNKRQNTGGRKHD